MNFKFAFVFDRFFWFLFFRSRLAFVLSMITKEKNHLDSLLLIYFGIQRVKSLFLILSFFSSIAFVQKGETDRFLCGILKVVRLQRTVRDPS